nr:MAG TPA: 50S ribosomal subunit [Caudoviricetes sp.]
MRVCPHCGKEYHGVPALSRTDSQTLICPDCGTRETLESIVVSKEEQEKIVSIIHRSITE